MTDAVGMQLPRSAQPEAAAPTRHVPGEPGIWIWLFGDMVVFTILFAVYLNRRGHDEVLFAESQVALNRTLGAIKTSVLLCSSMLIVLAALAFRSEHWRHLAPRLTLAGSLVGACFVIVPLLLAGVSGHS